MQKETASASRQRQPDSITDPELLAPAQACILHFPAVLRIIPGQTHPHVFLAEAMLQALRREFPEFKDAPVTGYLDQITSENLRRIQSCACLPETGELDKKTWNRLMRLYRALYDRYHAPTQG